LRFAEKGTGGEEARGRRGRGGVIGERKKGMGSGDRFVRGGHCECFRTHRVNCSSKQHLPHKSNADVCVGVIRGLMIVECMADPYILSSLVLA
jgi:hypothetical protein